MRIGIFTDVYPPFINGVSTSVLVLHKALVKLGHEVFIITVNNEKLKYNVEDPNIIRIPGIPVGIYDYRLTGIYPLRIINKIKKLNLDVIHSQTEFGIGTFARIISRQFDIPLVHTYHTMYEDYIYHVTKGHFNKPSQKLIEQLTKFYCDKTAQELIVPTKKAYDLFKEKYSIQRAVHIIPTGIDLSKYYKENYTKEQINKLKKQFNLTNDDFVVLFVGRLGQEKNIEFLIDAHILLSKKNLNCKLLIIGDGPLYKKFKTKIKKYKLEEQIILGGSVPYEEIGIYYQLASVFATASTAETQGLTVIEALASSVPILVINDESYAATLESGYNGYMFQTKKDYRKIIEHLYKNPKTLNIMKIQARNSSEKHSSLIFAQNVLSVYKLAIGEVNLEIKKTFFSRFKKVVMKNWKKKK